MQASTCRYYYNIYIYIYVYSTYIVSVNPYTTSGAHAWEPLSGIPQLSQREATLALQLDDRHASRSTGQQVDDV